MLHVHLLKKVQQTANQLYNDGYQVYIIGDPNHPEVVGIREWTDNEAIVIENSKQVDDLEIFQ